MWTKCGKLYFLKTCVLAYDRKTLIARNPRINLVLPDIILLNSFTFLMYETCVSVFVCVCVCLCACVSLCVYLCVEGGLVVYGLIPLSSHKATTASRRWLPWDTSCPPPLEAQPRKILLLVRIFIRGKRMKNIDFKKILLISMWFWKKIIGF